jgi:hypothetical protein
MSNMGMPRKTETGASASADDVHVERLALRVAGLDEGAARTLARLVAEKLAASLAPAAGTARLDALRTEVRLSAVDPAKPDVLAQQIADQVGRALARDRAAGGPDGEVAP